MKIAEDPSTDHLWQEFVNKIMAMVTNTTMWTAAALVLGRILLILLVSRLALMVINRIIDHLTSDRESLRLKLRTRRVQTVGKLLKNTAAYTINFIVVLLILGEFDIQLAPLLAGAGVLGLAIGFGAQSLVKDVITGFFIILEDQFAVGDVIETGTFKGTVEMIGLRATRIRSWTGEVHIVPNGSINAVTNFSVNQSLAVIDLIIPYDEQADETMEAIRTVLSKLTDPNMTGTPELLGIQKLALNEMTLRITAECKGNTQSDVTRVINTAVKKALEMRQNEAS
ncbi:mechanosensitive ion channel protein MscS [Cohnella kolymensis]|uniref:Mechanosensitive ion channel protein MscS n=2 Tax=Cohnella kolymensis TaxID=1590652 RepID=A0ABR5A5I2_9BACL|nr:mechanosensitive ion channel protein MscS [Cohnella kolymensis]